MSFFEGGRYISKSGRQVRVIERIHGNDIHYRDNCGSGRCGREAFRRWVDLLRSDPPPEQLKRGKYVLKSVILKLRMEVPELRRLYVESLALMQIQSRAKMHDEFRMGLSMFGNTVIRVEEAIRELPGRSGGQLAKITRIDNQLYPLQPIISSLIETLRPDSCESPEQEGAKHLLLVLTDMACLLDRLRSTLRPCIVQRRLRFSSNDD